MKYCNRLILLAAMLPLCLASCGDDSSNSGKPDIIDDSTSLNLSQASVSTSKTGGSYTVEATTNASSLTATPDADWVKASVVAGEPYVIKIEVEAYVVKNEETDYEPRKADIEVKAGSLTKVIMVEQSPEDLLMYNEATRINSVDQPYKVSDYRGTELVVGFKTNGDYQITYPWWIVREGKEDGKEGKFSVIERFTILANYSDEARYDSISFDLGDKHFACKIDEVATQFDFSGVRRTAQEVAQDMTLGWNMQEAYNDESVNVLSSWLLDTLAANGVNMVRIPCSFIDGAANAVNEFWLGGVVAAAKEVAAKEIGQGRNMYAIVSVADDGWLKDNIAKDDTTELYDTYVRLWNTIATQLAECDDHVLFEAYDYLSAEGLGEVGLRRINRLNELFVQTVRRNGGNNYKRCLLIPADGKSRVVTMPQNDVVDNRLMISFQFTRPEDYAGKSATKKLWGEPFKSKGDDWCSSLDEEGVRAYFSDFVSIMPRVPAIMTAFGSISHTGEEDLYADSEAYYANTVAFYAHENNVVPMVWDDNEFGKGCFGVFRRKLDEATGLCVTRRSYVKGIADGSVGKRLVLDEE